MYQIKKSTIVVFALLLIGFQLVFTYFERSSQSALKQSLYELAAETVFDELEEAIEDKQQSALMLSIGIASTLDHELTLSYQNDKPVLDDLVVKMDRLLKQLTRGSQYKNIWFQITSAEGNSFYRSWDEIQENLSKIRPEFIQMLHDKQPLMSISAGRYDLSLKSMVPIMRDGRVIGYLETITHFNSIQKQFEKQDIDSLVIATKARTELINKPFSKWRLFGHYVANLSPNTVLMDRITESDLRQWMSGESNFYVWENRLVIAYPIRANDDNVHGFYLAFVELDKLDIIPTITEQVSKHQSIAAWQYAAIGSLILFLMMALFRQQKMFYKDVLDSESEIVIITNGEALHETNSRFFDYFGNFASLKDFKKQYDCICDLFVKEEGYLQKEMEGQNWLPFLLKQPGHQYKVKIHCHSFDSEVRTFLIKANPIQKGTRLSVVVLTDITETEALNARLLQMSLKDELTQIGNRRAFNDVLNRQIHLAERQETAFSLIIFDIDNFKAINDEYGHDQGDVVLQTVADEIHRGLRQTDSFFRIGGEEFGVILLVEKEEEAFLVAEKIRKQVEGLTFDKIGQVTISLGVVEYYAGHQLQSSFETLFKAADNALYEAKKSGKNRVVVSQHLAHKLEDSD